VLRSTFRTHLKKVFWPKLGVGRSYPILEIPDVFLRVDIRGRLDFEPKSIFSDRFYCLRMIFCPFYSICSRYAIFQGALFHYSGCRVIFNPFVKFRILRFQHGQTPFEKLSLDAHQTVPLRIPERAGFLIIEHERPLVGPSRGGQGEYLAVDFAAVHSRQVNQRSVAGDNRP